MAYLNNIIIYSNNEEEHRRHIKQVLQRLYNKNIPITIKKYKFHTKNTNFIGFIIKPGQISIDPKNVQAIINQQDPESITSLRLFLKFCNYCRKFIAGWLEKIEPFTRITKKDKLQKQGLE